MSIFKNRTVIGVICIIVALVICFGVTPLFNQVISQKTNIVRVAKEIKVGEEITVDTPEERLRAIAAKREIPMDPAWDAPACVLELYETLCESTTTFPTFYLDFPTEVSPLTRKMPSEPRLAQKWDLVGWGAELGTAYTELIDPLDQRDRLVAQSLLAAAGDLEAMEVDEDFLRALEYGMPPAGGQGMGVERVIMMLTGQNIRDTMLFPLVKPE